MQLRSIANGGVVVVDAAFGRRLIDGGGWVEEGTDAPKPATKKPARTKPAPVVEPKTEE